MPAIDQSAETTGRGLPWREVKVVETAPETPRATISFEFAHVAARADAKVIVLDRGERPLKAFDPELVAKLLERTRTLGVTFHPNAAVEAIERTDRSTHKITTVLGSLRAMAEERVHAASPAFLQPMWSAILLSWRPMHESMSGPPLRPA